MTPFSFTHTFDAEPAQFWKVFFHEPFNEDMYQRIKVKERRILKFEENDTTILRQVKVMPARDLPGFMKKIVGGDFGYVEHNTIHKGKDTIDIVVEPTLFKDKTKMSGVFKVESLGPGKCRRSFAGTIAVSVPLLGGKIEDFIIAEMKGAYDAAAQVTAEWLKKDLP